MPDGEPTVIYIAGAGRSGSTILDTALGVLPRTESLGEVSNLFDASKTGGMCSCGERLTDCCLWGGVLNATSSHGTIA
ncbi:MAG TPA: hypothetical protein VJ865_11585, partial [Gemmatimonadaceae bacterium]|nr:hypothetical protein [Gemmatimonadaceae bacterium]